MPAKYTPEQRIEAFWNKVQKTDTCWLWTGSKNPKGYGQVNWLGKPRPVHIVAYELEVGLVPEGLELDHTCGITICVRPSHLEPVTHRENLRRGKGPTGLNFQKTHCKRGHEFNTANTYLKKGTYGIQRECRKCSAIAERERVKRLT